MFPLLQWRRRGVRGRVAGAAYALQGGPQEATSTTQRGNLKETQRRPSVAILVQQRELRDELGEPAPHRVRARHQPRNQKSQRER